MSPPPPPSFPEVTTGASDPVSPSCSALLPPSSSLSSLSSSSSPAAAAAAATASRKEDQANARISTSVSSCSAINTTITIATSSDRYHDPSTQGTDDLSVQSQQSSPPSSEQNKHQVVPSSLAQSSAATSLSTVIESSSMVFADFYRGPRSPLAKLRHSNPPSTGRSAAPPPAWLDEEYADLMVKDKVKQKEAVKRYLAAKVKNDWDFSGPAHDSQKVSTMLSQDQEGLPCTRLVPKESEHASPNTQIPAKAEDNAHQVDGRDDLHISSEHDDDDDNDDNDDDDEHGQDNDNESLYSVVSEDNFNFRPRLEWASELSDDEDAMDVTQSSFQNGHSTSDKRTSRRRANREEMTWNEGLACFEARRNAWTGARTVRVRSKPASTASTSPRSPRCFFFLRSSSGSTPGSNPSVPESPRGGEGGSFTTSDTCSLTKGDRDLEKQKTKSSNQSSNNLFPVQTLLPIPHPILPPNNTLRASITPSIYLGLYDKVILNSLQPACPINLSDMLRACVAGWRRDGEWPPRPSVIDPLPARKKKQQQQQQPKRASAGNSETVSTARRMSFDILGRGGDDESRTGKGIRRSIQKAFGFGSSPGGAET